MGEKINCSIGVLKNREIYVLKLVLNQRGWGNYMAGGDLEQTQWKSYHAGNNTFQIKVSIQTQNGKANNITTDYTETV